MTKETVLKTNIQFEGRVLYDLLGGEVIESDSIAIAEQIKNAKDAGADNITIDLSEIDEDVIVIKDNGNGMSEREIIDNWFTIGTSNKTNQQGILGGKGIGRLSLFRLANTITVETINNNIKHTFSLNKDSLESNGFNNINIYQENVMNQDSMTKIILNGLSKYIDLFEIESGLENLNHPNHSKIHSIIFPNSYREQKYEFSKSTITKAPFYATATIEGGNITSYKFECVVKGNTLFENKNMNSKLITTLDKELKDRYYSEINLGEIKIELYNFFFDNPYLKWHGDIDKDYINKHFLQAYQGISVYRNGYKIYGHGEEDWLKLAANRVSRAGANIDNKLSYGFVTLDSQKSLSLKEKTSREGFIKSPELSYFRAIVLCVIKQIGLDRESSVKNIRQYMKENPKPVKEVKPAKNITKESKQEENKVIQKKSESTDYKKNEIQSSENTPLEKEKLKEPCKPILTENPVTKKGKSYLNKNTIIDMSFECNPRAPEKIKQIIEELKQVKHINAQALLLRCLIDISTQYYQLNNEIEILNNKLPNNIRKVLNNFNDKKSLDHKVINRVRESINKQASLQYFNGVAHDYDYRPNFTDIKDMWNTFEPYITACISN